ncbi:hypothetical protein [Consotaella aegiceratis]|uniref:hypothetical protein n=1 Tax=Consotaella aegiceratis TaxID=3097961 RepID=UPI002F4107F5
MADKNLTFDEAVECWLLRAQGMMRRHIWARFRVDPRRVYEVWSGLDHEGSREEAIQQFQKQYPNKSIEGLFDWHIPHRKVQFVSLQGSLFDR